MINGTAVGIVRIHVTEGDAVRQAGRGIALCIEPLGLQYLVGQSKAGTPAGGEVSQSDRRVKSTWAEKIRQCSRDVSLSAGEYAARGKSIRRPDKERTGW